MMSPVSLLLWHYSLRQLQSFEEFLIVIQGIVGVVVPIWRAYVLFFGCRVFRDPQSYLLFQILLLDVMMSSSYSFSIFFMFEKEEYLYIHLFNSQKLMP